MAIILDMYSLPVPQFANIIAHFGGSSAEVDNYFLTEYEATVIKGTWDQWQYMFTNREKYVEFALKWL